GQALLGTRLLHGALLREPSRGATEARRRGATEGRAERRFGGTGRAAAHALPPRLPPLEPDGGRRRAAANHRLPGRAHGACELRPRLAPPRPPDDYALARRGARAPPLLPRREARARTRSVRPGRVRLRVPPDDCAALPEGRRHFLVSDGRDGPRRDLRAVHQPDVADRRPGRRVAQPLPSASGDTARADRRKRIGGVKEARSFPAED